MRQVGLIIPHFTMREANAQRAIFTLSGNSAISTSRLKFKETVNFLYYVSKTPSILSLQL